MYPSDYGYAAGTSSCLATSLNNYGTDCYKKNWLYSGGEHMITPGGITTITHLTVAGNVIPYSEATSSAAVRPVVYLKANILTTGGDGSSTSPYQLGLQKNLNK